MKKISLVQPNFNWGPVGLDIYYLPYSAGVLWAYVNKFDDIKKQYSFGEFVWRRDRIEEVVQRLQSCDVVGFSTYVWNRNYNYILAERLREVNPDCLIIFGGPEVEVTDPDIFIKHPFIDVVVKQEGEHSFYSVLTGNYNVPGLLVNNNGSLLDTGPSQRVQNLNDIPSPYLTGVFDNLIEQYPDIIWNTTLETNRGCPYQCTFCDWGSLTYSKVKKYNLEQIFNEIEWFAKIKTEFVGFTDANFGIFPDRDMLIAQKLVEQKKATGYPKMLNLSWAKNQKQSVVDIIAELTNGGFNSGLNLSLQTLTDDVLKNIKRKNLEMNRVQEVFELCDKRGIPCFTELILGLPGETLSTWKKVFYDLYDFGNHTGISVYQCQLIENAEMNLHQIDEYDVKSVRVADYFESGYYEDDIKEDNAIVVSTRDLPIEDMISAYMFTWFQKTFHIEGLTNYIARFLNKFMGESYENFYNKFEQYILQDDWFSNEYQRVYTSVKQWYTEGEIDKHSIGSILVNGENIQVSTLYRLHVDDKLDYTFDLINKFLKLHYPIDFVDGLVDFQKNSTIVYEKLHKYPISNTYTHNFYDYIVNNQDLDQNTTIQFNNRDTEVVDKDIFVQRIWFRRRDGYGKAKITVDNDY